MKRVLLQFLLVFPYIVLSLFSYAYLDPNLVLSSHPWYWAFQNSMWQLGYHMRTLSTTIYIVDLLLIFLSTWICLKQLTQQEKIWMVISIIIVLFFSHNALSHDIFNYMFNAKMVLQYQMNPHIHVALEVFSDDWVRFMHNTHTPAPYGYGWTILSLIPSLLGRNIFTVTYLLFRLFMICGFGLLYQAQKSLANRIGQIKQFQSQKWLFYLSPLVLIETVANQHNDVWMMFFVFLGLWCVLANPRNWIHRIFGLVFLATSISVKFASAVLFPTFLIFFFRTRLKNIYAWWAELSAVCMLLPLFSSRSQQFHPWYLIWSLSFLPFMRNRMLKIVLLALSFSSMLRYVPYMFIGDYTSLEFAQEKLITWGLGFLIALTLFVVQKSKISRSHA